MGNERIDELQPVSVSGETKPVEQVFDSLSKDRHLAAAQLYGCLEQGTAPEEIIRAARQLVFLKGNDSHDYKYSSAILEDFYHVSPAWRNRCLAASVFQLRGSGEPDNGLIARIRQAIG